MTYSNNPLNLSAEQDPSVRYRNVPEVVANRARDLSNAWVVSRNYVRIATNGLVEPVAQPIEAAQVINVPAVPEKQEYPAPPTATGDFDRARQIREATALADQAFREAA